MRLLQCAPMWGRTWKQHLPPLRQPHLLRVRICTWMFLVSRPLLWTSRTSSADTPSRDLSIKKQAEELQEAELIEAQLVRNKKLQTTLKAASPSKSMTLLKLQYQFSVTRLQSKIETAMRAIETPFQAAVRPASSLRGGTLPLV